MKGKISEKSVINELSLATSWHVQWNFRVLPGKCRHCCYWCCHLQCCWSSDTLANSNASHCVRILCPSAVWLVTDVLQFTITQRKWTCWDGRAALFSGLQNPGRLWGPCGFALDCSCLQIGSWAWTFCRSYWLTPLAWGWKPVFWESELQCWMHLTW